MKSYFLGLLIIFVPLISAAQAEGIQEIESAYESGNFQLANNILNGKIKKYVLLQQPDSLLNYIFISGKIHVAAKNVARGNQAVEKMISTIKSLKPSAATLKQAYIEAGDYFGLTGDNKRGYEQNLIADKYARQAKSTPSQLALIQNNLSTFSQKQGNISQMQQHNRNSIHLLKNDPDPDYVTLYVAQNMMGSSMYYTSRLDSAVYFYEEAIQTLKKTPPTPVNQYYRTAIIQNNLAGIYNQQGNSQKAIDAMYENIQNLEKFTVVTEPGQRKSTAQFFQFQAIDNLAAIYKGLGDLSRARELLEFSYNKKRQNLVPENPGIFISQILIGQIYNAMHEEETALKYTREGISNYEKSANPDPMWLGDGYNTLALIYDANNNEQLAELYYNKADSSFLDGLAGSYDEIYLEFSRSKAQFFAKNGKFNQARNIAAKTYQYTLNVQDKESFAVFYQLLNISEIEYRAGNFEKAESYATKGLDLLNKKIRNATSLMDSIKMENYKPNAILYKSRAKYYLLNEKSAVTIQPILNDLNEAIDIIERKKGFVNDPGNTKVIISENQDLFDFVKTLQIELYRLTADDRYIDRIMNVQESALYTRIRSRLNNDSIRFAHIPEKVQNREKELNELVLKYLNASGNTRKPIQQYLTALTDVQEFRESLKKSYPEYYKLRYASFISDSLPIEKMIRPGISLVRYFFIDTSLFVLVADNGMKKIVPLSSRNLKQYIEEIYQQTKGISKVSDALYQLHQLLWKPIELFVRNKSVVVIPDGILFNLNLEILTPEKIHSYKELATKSLLSKYTFSYQYSMFLLKQGKNSNPYSEKFTGFAPGFSDAVKANYRQKVNDSIRIDYSYLRMLPQPFTISLLKDIYPIFGGNIFLNLDCTKDQFVKRAGNSQIIHVGTHAISDNQYPQYSRLIFTKDADGSSDNELYVHDIYHYDLSSELTVLSACETGKPGYEDGEGMISLAQAFNYAGSKSILTGLWKIDEKSSAILLDAFYKNLKKGMQKDEALRQAKLTYLENENGRMLEPQFWAGLIIMGDTSALTTSNNSEISIYIIIGGMLLIFILGTYFIIRKRKIKRV